MNPPIKETRGEPLVPEETRLISSSREIVNCVDCRNKIEWLLWKKDWKVNGFSLIFCFLKRYTTNYKLINGFYSSMPCIETIWSRSDLYLNKILTFLILSILSYLSFSVKTHVVLYVRNYNKKTKDAIEKCRVK